ncbi:MAG: hypothetical protein E6R03_08825 [Hyphomicrobiaceae bacterium]|nr:MAG: hypothetical protein E6R03_08825 [Hyphomicrobiaceae bacterium]
MTQSEEDLDRELRLELEYDLTRDAEMLALWSDRLREVQNNPHAPPHVRVYHAKEIARLRRAIARSKRLLAWGARTP